MAKNLRQIKRESGLEVGMIVEVTKWRTTQSKVRSKPNVKIYGKYEGKIIDIPNNSIFTITNDYGAVRRPISFNFADMHTEKEGIKVRILPELPILTA